VIENEDTTTYRVVVNHEEQYSIWPIYLENPPGWRDTGKRGQDRVPGVCSKRSGRICVPLSLRKKMEEAEQRQIASRI